MIRIGIVGLGFMAATHLKAYRHVEGVRIAALCNPSGRNLDGDFSRVAGNVGDPNPLRLDMSQIKAYRDYGALLADPDIDLIDICAPTHTHPDLAVAALRSGKHVLCEKPLARTPDDARRIAAAAASAPGLFMPAMCLRFWPEWAWLHSAIQSAPYGPLQGLRLQRIAEPPAWGQAFFFDGARSGGALLDLHIHDTDFIQGCLGRPQAVFSTGFSKVSGAIDHVVTQYLYPSGLSVSAEGSWAMTEGFGFNMAFTVIFQNATASYDIARGPDALKLFVKGKPPEVIRPPGIDGYVEELRYFTRCIADRTPPSRVTADDAARAVEICAAEERSVQTGQIVRLG